MPFLSIHTNAQLKDRNPTQFIEEASVLIARELHKPISYVIVILDSNPDMAFVGSHSQKGALVEMKSIGFSDKRSLAKILTEFLADRLDIAELNNINIDFVDMPASSVAIGGSLLG